MEKVFNITECCVPCSGHNTLICMVVWRSNAILALCMTQRNFSINGGYYSNLLLN